MGVWVVCLGWVACCFVCVWVVVLVSVCMLFYDRTNHIYIIELVLQNLLLADQPRLVTMADTENNFIVLVLPLSCAMITATSHLYWSANTMKLNKSL